MEADEIRANGNTVGGGCTNDDIGWEDVDIESQQDKPTQHEDSSIDDDDIEDPTPTYEDMVEDENRANIHAASVDAVNIAYNDEEDVNIVDESSGSDQENISLEAIHIPEAFLVEEGEEGRGTVYDAIPAIPWWKQRKVKILLGIGFVTLAALAIALGVTLTREEETVTEFVPVTFSPSISMSPSLAPSVSFAPSPVPSLQPSFMPTLTPTAYWSSIPWQQQGVTIPGESAGDEAGTSITLSGDGRTLAIGFPGAYGNNDRPGYVKVYCKQFDLQPADFTVRWKWKLVVTLTGDTIGDRFGQTVSISENNKTLAIGAAGFWEMKDRPGYVRVYTSQDDNTMSNWTQLGEDIEGEANGDQSGVSLSLSADGSTIVIGANANAGNGQMSGHVRIYELIKGSGSSSVTSWEQVGQDIDGEAAGDNAGVSISLSATGRMVAIGAPYNNGTGEYSGHVRIYNRVGNEWEQIGHDIHGENSGDIFGFSVSMSDDGMTIAVGALFNDDNGEHSGKVKVYRLGSGKNWSQIGQDLIGEAAGDRAGGSISLSGDGKALAIGAVQNDSNGDAAGQVRIYRLADYLSWVQVGKDIDGVNAGDNAGWSVSLSSDGKVVALGSHWNGDNGYHAGHVRVFGVDDTEVFIR